MLEAAELDGLHSLDWQGWFSLGVVALSFGLFAFTRYAPDIITTGALSLLFLFPAAGSAAGAPPSVSPGMREPM